MKSPALPLGFSSQAFQKALLRRLYFLIIVGINTGQHFYFQKLAGKQHSKSVQKVQFDFKTQMEELENNLGRGSVDALSICCSICRSCQIKTPLRIYNANTVIMAQEHKQDKVYGKMLFTWYSREKIHVGVLYKESELPQDFSAVSFAALKRGYGVALDFHRYGQGGEGELEL